MKKVSNRTLEVYKKIFVVSSSILIVVLQIYIMVLSNGIDIVGFNFIYNSVLRVFLQFLFQIVFFAIVGTVVFAMVTFITKLIWKKVHSEIVYEGTWLHIHEKDPIRIGTVVIAQDFYDLSANGVNIGVNTGMNEEETQKTGWSYYDAVIEPDGNEARKGAVKLIGCYCAQKRGSNITNHGIHYFDDDDSYMGKPYYLKGRFNDVFQIDDTEDINISNKAGRIYLIKLTPKIKEYIYTSGKINYKKLSTILNEESVSEELFVQKLRRIVTDYDKKKNSESKNNGQKN